MFANRHYFASSQVPQITMGNGAEDEEKLVHHLKWIEWRGVQTPIVTQNENGPCPLVAIANVLLMRGKLGIQSGEELVTAPRLLDMIGNAMVENMPKVGCVGLDGDEKFIFVSSSEHT